MAQSIQFASEFNLDACKIYSHEKEVFADISDTVISIDISENIFQSSVEGFIVDSIDPKSNDVSTTGGLITGILFITISFGTLVMAFVDRRD